MAACQAGIRDQVGWRKLADEPLIFLGQKQMDANTNMLKCPVI